MKQVTLNYDEMTQNLYDATGAAFYVQTHPVSVENQDDAKLTLELIKQGVTPDEIIKLKNNGLV